MLGHETQCPSFQGLPFSLSCFLLHHKSLYRHSLLSSLPLRGPRGPGLESWDHHCIRTKSKILPRERLSRLLERGLAGPEHPGGSISFMDSCRRPTLEGVVGGSGLKKDVGGRSGWVGGHGHDLRVNLDDIKKTEFENWRADSAKYKYLLLFQKIHVRFPAPS